MAETPDFKQLAWTLKSAIDDHPSLSEQNMRLISDLLRLVWNARGAADLAKLDAMTPGDQWEEELKTLDR